MHHSLCNIELNTDLANDITPQEVMDFCNDRFFYDLQEEIRKAFPECDLSWYTEKNYCLPGITGVLRVTYKSLSKAHGGSHYMEEFSITRFNNRYVELSRWSNKSNTVMSGYNIDLRLPNKVSKNYKLSATSIKKYVTKHRRESESYNDPDILLSYDEMSKHYWNIIKCLVKTRYKSIRKYIDDDKVFAKREADARNIVDLELIAVSQPIRDCFKKHWVDFDEIRDTFLHSRSISSIGVRCEKDHMSLILMCPDGHTWVRKEDGMYMLVALAMMQDKYTKAMLDKEYSYEKPEELLTALDITLTYMENIRNGMNSYENKPLLAYKASMESLEDIPANI